MTITGIWKRRSERKHKPQSESVVLLHFFIYGYQFVHGDAVLQMFGWDVPHRACLAASLGPLKSADIEMRLTKWETQNIVTCEACRVIKRDLIARCGLRVYATGSIL